MAIRESMLGERFQRALNPPVKYFRLTIKTGRQSRNWVRAKISRFSSPMKIPGRGQCIIWPIAR